jgi:hypothetical protein
MFEELKKNNIKNDKNKKCNKNKKNFIYSCDKCGKTYIKETDRCKCFPSNTDEFSNY